MSLVTVLIILTGATYESAAKRNVNGFMIFLKRQQNKKHV